MWEFCSKTCRFRLTMSSFSVILISMAPDDLQDTILQHADRLKEYKLVKEKMVGLLYARARLNDPNATDIDFAGEDDWWWDDAESGDVDVAAIGKGDHRYRCVGVGHIPNECPTPKGKGKEDKGFNSNGSKGKGKSYSGKGFEKGEGKKHDSVRALWETRTRYFAVLDASSRPAPLEVRECC